MRDISIDCIFTKVIKIVIFIARKQIHMTLKEAIAARHSVRKYTDAPIEPEKQSILLEAIRKANAAANLNIQLVTNEPKAFAAGNILSFSYGVFHGVRNYLVMAAPNDAKEAIGYHGEHIVLLAQTLGLNSCWVGLTYKEVPGVFHLRHGDKLHCVIALGYGTTQGVQHKMKNINSLVDAPVHLSLPSWFMEGMNAVALAPSAVNQQKYGFNLLDGNVVEAKSRFSWVGYTQIDLGIAKCHFEIGAGKENFRWKE